MSWTDSFFFKQTVNLSNLGVLIIYTIKKRNEPKELLALD